MKNYFVFGKTKYEYALEVSPEPGVFRFICESLGMNEEFLAEDIPQLILDLPNIALNLKEHDKNNSFIKFRVSPTEKTRIEKVALAKGFKNTSDYIRTVALS